MERARDDGSPERPDGGAAPAEKAAEDVVFVHGATEHGVQITRLRDQRVESGELRAIKDGQPIMGELVKLSPREESERLFNVEVIAKGPMPTPEARAHKGPARIASERFRSNWDAVFSPPKTGGGKGELPS
jgi:hypothetical protein